MRTGTIFSIFLFFSISFAGICGQNGGDQLAGDASSWERPRRDLLWNFGNMYQPCVLEFPEEAYRYKMWFFGWASEDCNPGYEGCDAIYHARSRDLEEWEIYSGDSGWDNTMDPAKWFPVLTASGKEYEAWHVGDPSVVHRDGRFYMAYSATSHPRYREMENHLDGMMLCVMGATSDDGIRWTKTDQPLLIEPVEVRQATSDENWIGDYHRPCLMWEDGKWRLWFDYWATRKYGVCMGYAENRGEFGDPGGFKIVHGGAEPLIVCWPNPEVVRVGDRYHSFADPNGYPPRVDDPNEAWTSRAIREAVSEDGLDWTVCGFIDPDTDTAACHVPQALVTEVGGKEYLYLFYATQRGGSPNYNYRYDRIRSWRSEIPAE